MTRLSWFLPCALVAIARLAAAQPALADDPPPPPAPPSQVVHDHAFFGGGVLISGDHFLNGAWMFDGGVRIGRLPLWAHATAATGGAIDADGRGDFWRLTAGIEAQGCTEANNCVFAGVDAGYEHQTYNADPGTEIHHGPVIGPRLGVDAGGRNLRFRGALEIYGYDREFVGMSPPSWQVGLGLTLAVVYRL